VRDDSVPGDRPPTSDEPLEQQVARLADFIMDEIPGEPSQSEGAVDTAIRLLRAARGASPAGEDTSWDCGMDNFPVAAPGGTAREPSEVERILQQMADCNLSDNNCASWDVANRRIRNLANRALTALRAAPYAP
jgi:hypothetical protein